jgi:hypothetical protein
MEIEEKELSAVLIALIAFLVCFELPRGEALFAIDEAAKLALDDHIITGHVTGLSTSSAQMSFAPNSPVCLSNRTVQLYLDALGWIEAEVSSGSRTAVGLRLRRTISNSWSGYLARRPATLPIPPACEASFSERYRRVSRKVVNSRQL